MKEERPFRHTKYQHLFAEHQIDFASPLALSWDNSKALYPSESILEIDLVNLEAANRSVLETLLRIVLPQLTPMQRRIVELFRTEEDITQAEAALAMGAGKGNSLIVKSLKGNIDYRTGKGVRYGGVARKAMLICLASEEYRLAILNLSNLEMGGSMLRLTQSWFDSPFDFFFWLHDPLDLTLKISSSLINNIINKYIDYYILNRKL